MKKVLTIGMPCFNDHSGVWSTTTSLLLHHTEVAGRIQILVVDGNPESEHGRATAHFCANAGPSVRYVKAGDANGTAQTKELVFTHAETEFVMCMDCHVLLAPSSVGRLLEFLETDDGNLLQGPLVYDNLTTISTHMEEVWRGGMLGIWATDERGRNPDAEPFEIPAQGMGVFACRRDAWPSFHPLFRGFGGEECYIHEKFRRAGKKTLCLPFLRWSHRFGRPDGIPYQNIMEDRIHNYVIGHLELNINPQVIRDHFITLLPSEKVDMAGANALEAYREWMGELQPEVHQQELCTA